MTLAPSLRPASSRPALPVLVLSILVASLAPSTAVAAPRSYALDAGNAAQWRGAMRVGGAQEFERSTATVPTCSASPGGLMEPPAPDPSSCDAEFVLPLGWELVGPASFTFTARGDAPTGLQEAAVERSGTAGVEWLDPKAPAAPGTRPLEQGSDGRIRAVARLGTRFGLGYVVQAPTRAAIESVSLTLDEHEPPLLASLELEGGLPADQEALDQRWLGSCVDVAATWQDRLSVVETTWIEQAAHETNAAAAFDLGEWSAPVVHSGEACPPAGGAGTKVVELAARDLFGNVGRSELRLRFDAAPPVVGAVRIGSELHADGDAIIEPDAAATLAWDVDDPHSGLHEETPITLSIDGEPVALQRTAAGIAVRVQLPIGSHRWSVRATDVLGNAGTRSGVLLVQAPAPVAVAPTGEVTSGAPAAAAFAGRIGHVDRTPPTLQVRVVHAGPGVLRRSNVLVLRVRASERSLWRLQLVRFGAIRSTIAFGTSWRTVRINLGDANLLGRTINAARPGETVRIWMRSWGWDRRRNVARATWMSLDVRA